MLLTPCYLLCQGYSVLGHVCLFVYWHYILKTHWQISIVHKPRKECSVLEQIWIQQGIFLNKNLNKNLAHLVNNCLSLCIFWWKSLSSYRLKIKIKNNKFRGLWLHCLIYTKWDKNSSTQKWSNYWQRHWVKNRVVYICSSCLNLITTLL